MSGPSRIVVQLTDPHIVEVEALCVGRIDTAAFLASAVDAIAALEPAPDLVLCTGDLVNDGRSEQYGHLRRLLGGLPASSALRLMPGNHDDRAALRDAFPEHDELTGGEHLDQDIDLDPLRILALDSLIPGDPAGDLRDSQLSWLDDRLGEAPERPTIVALHHPPFATGIQHMDAIGLAPDATAGLARVIERHPHVERVLCGHLHRCITRRFAGTVAMIAPSVAHAVALDLADGAPAGWTYEPPGVLVHRWTPDEGLVSHLLPIGPFVVHGFGPAPADTPDA